MKKQANECLSAKPLIRHSCSLRIGSIVNSKVSLLKPKWSFKVVAPTKLPEWTLLCNRCYQKRLLSLIKRCKGTGSRAHKQSSQVQTPLTRFVSSSLCLATAWSIASRKLSRVTVGVCIEKMLKHTNLFFNCIVQKQNLILTFTNSAWARNGNFLSALPLNPLLFLKTRGKNCKNISL